MSSWLDVLPSNERAKIKERMRSPAAYEKLRQNVKGPEDLEREMEKNEAMAELKFALETEPSLREALGQQIEKDMKEKGMEAVLEGQLEGAFDVAVDADTNQLVVVPEGNIAEKIPITSGLSEQYVAQFVDG